MGKIKGNNVRLYLDDDLLMHTDEVSFNFDTDTEEVTDADDGNWASNLPTLNRWNVDVSFWYHNSAVANWEDVMTAYLNQEQLTLECELETEVKYSGTGYLTNLSPSGGTGAGHVKCSAGFIGTGELT